MATLFNTATEYTANEVTLLRGTVADIVSVGVYHNTDPNVIPTVAQFTTVTLVDGTDDPLPPLAEDGKIDILALIGPRDGDLTLTPGDYQRWSLIVTATEDVIRKLDVLEVV